MVFRGTFDYSLDAKNRLTVPARFRAALAEGVVLAKGLERCVALWTPSGYDAYTQASLAGFHPLSPEAQKLKRFFSANSLDTELDAAGRVMVPAFLLDARRPRQGGRRHRLRRRAGDLGPRHVGRVQRRAGIRRHRHHRIPWPHCLR